MKISAVILAGGKGSRMQSDLPKPMQLLGDKTLLTHVVEKLDQLEVDQKIIVVGWRANEIIETHKELDVKWIVQPEPKGNGDALRHGLSLVDSDTNTVLSLHADDSSFYKSETLKEFIEAHTDRNLSASFMTVEKPDITPRFRVLKDGENRFLGFVPLTEEDKSKPVEFFTGCACFSLDWLKENITELQPSEAVAGEISIHTLFIRAVEGGKICVYKLQNPEEWRGINTPRELEEANLLYLRSKER